MQWMQWMQWMLSANVVGISAAANAIGLHEPAVLLLPFRLRGAANGEALEMNNWHHFLPSH